MDVHVCENCLTVVDVRAGEPAPASCPACDRPGSIVEAYVSDRFARVEDAQVTSRE